MRIVLNVGNVLELVGAGLGTWGAYLMFGLAISLIVGAVFILIGAELVYDGHTFEVPIWRSKRPRPDGETTVRYRP